jgi:hypothetical protein
MRRTIDGMRDQTENEVTEQLKAAGPYGDVALGVECAWPQLMPLEQPAPAELQA